MLMDVKWTRKHEAKKKWAKSSSRGGRREWKNRELKADEAAGFRINCQHEEAQPQLEMLDEGRLEWAECEHLATF